MLIRPYVASDFAAVTALWDATGISIHYNDPAKDYARRLVHVVQLQCASNGVKGKHDYPTQANYIEMFITDRWPPSSSRTAIMRRESCAGALSEIIPPIAAATSTISEPVDRRRETRPCMPNSFDV